MNILVIFLIRLIVPFIILKNPLLGGIVVILADFWDRDLILLLNNGNLVDYQLIDKLLDVYYLTFEVAVVLTWKNKLVRKVALGLFLYRFLGFLLFLIFQIPIILVIFPNIFEYFYLFYLSSIKLFKKDIFSSIKVLIIILIIFTAGKVMHEYFLHINTSHPWTENKYIKIVLNFKG